MYIQQLMQAEGCIPAGAVVNISDLPNTVAATRIVYGNDGRRVYVIEWTEGTTSFGQNAGMLVVATKNYPEGYGDWKKNTESADVERVGRQKNPDNSMPLPGVTYVS